MPLGLLQISSGIYKEYKVKIIDQRDKNWKKYLNKELNKNPICVTIASIIEKQVISFF